MYYNYYFLIKEKKLDLASDKNIAMTEMYTIQESLSLNCHYKALDPKKWMYGKIFHECVKKAMI